MFIPPIADKKDICFYAENHFKKTNKAIEIGVWMGVFANHNLKTWKGQYYLCDAWAIRKEDLKRGLLDKNINVDWKKIKEIAINNVTFAQERIIIKQGLSTDIAKTFADNFFDWIYIDAMHDYQNFKKDLNNWWSKLRDGGLFSGDDYGLCENSLIEKTVTPERWEAKIGKVAINNKWGVINALCEFCKEKKLQLNVTWLNDKTKYPAWYIIKPNKL